MLPERYRRTRAEHPCLRHAHRDIELPLTELPLTWRHDEGARLNYNAIAKHSRHGRTHASTPRVCCRLALAHPALFLPSGAKRSGQAERSGKKGIRGSHPTMTTQLSYSPKKPSATGRLSTAGKGVSEVSSNCDYSQKATRTREALTLNAGEIRTPSPLGQRR
jgi:hypothetical protein